MKLFYQPDIMNGSHFLTEEESKHCIKVLRHIVGDTLDVVDGTGSKFKVRILEAHQKKTTFDIISHQRKDELPYYIHIGIAPTKQIERTEWFLEKAIEIGVDEISFFFGRHSERKNINLERMQKKAVSAMKQSLKYQMPIIKLYQDLESLISHIPEKQSKYIAYVDFDNPHKLKDKVQVNENSVVLIGPEGDFNKTELELAFSNGFQKVSLGQSRLRTETAGLVACHTLNLMNS
ncbi:MAG: 16S rRNA (uracil(1498)-N(3))-methyltransferase [Cyclobacteriaceae bacterium]|nr:16S rRNA (uracil(1498)-N(3))-methyltransferase [Cyclobacteriaceae bacterium]